MSNFLYVLGNPNLKIVLREKKIVFAGKCSVSRNSLVSILSINEAFVQTSINKSTDLLIIDNLSRGLKKVQRAKELGVKILTYGDVFKNVCD